MLLILWQYFLHGWNTYFILQVSWGQLTLRSSTTWRWAVNFWQPVSWLKPCPTITLLWVRLHTHTHTQTCRHTETHIYILATGWHFQSCISALFDIFQRETLRITWHTTSEPQCFWPWGNPNLPCQTWPEPSSSSLTSLLWVHLITSRTNNLYKVLILCACASSWVSPLLSHTSSSSCHVTFSFPGQAPEREYPFKAGQHAGGQGGLWSSGKFTDTFEICVFPVLTSCFLTELNHIEVDKTAYFSAATLSRPRRGSGPADESKRAGGAAGGGPCCISPGGLQRYHFRAGASHWGTYQLLSAVALTFRVRQWWLPHCRNLEVGCSFESWLLH